MAANDSNQAIAVVNRGAVIARRIGDTIDQQGFDVGFELLQTGVTVGDGLPVFEIERRFHGSSGAGILCDHTSGSAAVNEESEIDGDQQAFPLVIIDGEIVQPVNVARNAAVALPGVSGEENRAGITGASDLMFIQLEQVLMKKSER